MLMTNTSEELEPQALVIFEEDYTALILSKFAVFSPHNKCKVNNPVLPQIWMHTLL